MTDTTAPSAAGPSDADRFIDDLYHELVKVWYDKSDARAARPLARRLGALLADAPGYRTSIRGEEIRSMVAEIAGDLDDAIRCREAEIRKILFLHDLTERTGGWEYVRRRYDHSDVGDRMDLLAMLYDRNGDTERAVSVLEDSKTYCRAKGIRFEGASLLRELRKALAPTKSAATRRAAPGKSARKRPVRPGTAADVAGRKAKVPPITMA